MPKFQIHKAMKFQCRIEESLYLTVEFVETVSTVLSRCDEVSWLTDGNCLEIETADAKPTVDSSGGS
jgi:hypothetical protein